MAWNGNIGFGEWIARGTYQGYRYGYGKLDQPKKIEIQGVDVLVLDDNGLVKEEIAYYNMCDVLKQIQH